MAGLNVSLGLKHAPMDCFQNVLVSSLPHSAARQSTWLQCHLLPRRERTGYFSTSNQQKLPSSVAECATASLLIAVLGKRLMKVTLVCVQSQILLSK